MPGGGGLTVPEVKEDFAVVFDGFDKAKAVLESGDESLVGLHGAVDGF